VDWTRCRGHGLCAHLVPELVQLDGQGFPVFLDMPVPHWLRTEAQQAVQMCPSLALKLTTPAPREAARPAIPQGAGNLKLIASSPAEPGLDVTEEWIAEISDVGRQIPRPIR
jgi:ferredoxin